jgi:soluble lytic murein transglycosylase-like protein
MMAFRKLAFVLIVSFAIMVLAAAPLFASQDAVLRNGFSIRHERRAVIGAVTRLYVNGDGSSYIDIPTDEIEHFEDAPARIKTDSSIAENRVVPQQNANPVDLNQVIAAASGRYRLDPDLVNSVIRAESGFNVRAVSRKGAQGLMQLMPGTASKLGVPNAFDPEANVEGGTKYLRELLERYNFDLVKALAAYNAGPQRVEQYGGVPPYFETRAYVARIVRDFNRKKLAAKGAAVQPSALPKHAKTKTLSAGTVRQDKVPVVRSKATAASQ